MKLEIKPQDRRDPVQLVITVPAALNDRLKAAAAALDNSDPEYVAVELLDHALPELEQKKTAPAVTKIAKAPKVKEVAA